MRYMLWKVGVRTGDETMITTQGEGTEKQGKDYLKSMMESPRRVTSNKWKNFPLSRCL